MTHSIVVPFDDIDALMLLLHEVGDTQFDEMFGDPYEVVVNSASSIRTGADPLAIPVACCAPSE